MSKKKNEDVRKAVWGSQGKGVTSGQVLAGEESSCPHDEDGEGPCPRCALAGLEDTGLELRLLRSKDVEHCVRNLTPSQRDLLILKPEEAMIAGGYVRSCIANDRIRDIDYFVSSKAQATEMSKALENWHTIEEKNIRTSDYAITLVVTGQTPIQLIYRYTFEGPADVLSTFDFTVSQAAIWYGLDSRWRGVCAKTYYDDLAAHRLIYTNPGGRTDQDISLMFRIVKHVSLGYHIDTSNMSIALARAVKDVTGLPLDIPKITKDLQDKMRNQSMSPDFEKLCAISQKERTLKIPKPVYRDDNWS